MSGGKFCGGKLWGEMEEELMSEFQEFHIVLESGSVMLDRLRDLTVEHGLTPAELCNDWMAYSAQNGSCDLTDVSCDGWALKLATRNKAKRDGTRMKSVAKRRPERKVHTKNDYNELFDDDVMGQYGDLEALVSTHFRCHCSHVSGPVPPPQHKCGVKRLAEEATPPSSMHKSRAMENGATPTTPSQKRPSHQTSTPSHHNGFVASTPTGTYAQRKNSGAVICSLNDRGTPTNWRGGRQEVKVVHYDPSKALTKPYHYMFQKVSDKAIALLEHTEEFGSAVCDHHSLPQPLSIAQPSLEVATYIGRVVCDGEGHLNASSCLLEGPVRSRALYSHRVRLEIPETTQCCLFPGQVVAVEGINNYSGSLIPNAIYDQGVFPPLPKRTQDTVGGFSLLAAAGPFSTSDSLDMAPLNDIIRQVREEEPNVLLLMGPYVDVNNSVVKTGCLPEGLTLQEFFSQRVLQPLLDCIRGLRTQLLIMPSQRDAHHPFEVYPQPPFQDSCLRHLKRTPYTDQGQVLFLSDPCTLSINGVCLGATSTDVLFHLSARTMFRGASGDRMARLAGHILRQQCYYPLVPPYRKEEGRTQVKAETTDSEVPTDVPRPPSEQCEVNLDYIQAFEEQYTSLPARPDILLLPSDLKPFVKVLDGCVCVNPGHLTRKASGGTFMTVIVPELPAKPDLSTDLAISVIHI